MDDQRTLIVTEMCPHCESEVEMRWDTDTMGFRAFCPVCGNRLMLCDECQHSDGGPCDYDSKTDSCRHNPATPVTNEIPPALRVETPLGAIIVRVPGDPDHPGVWIDLLRPDTDQDMPLAMVEFCRDEGDQPIGEPNIITRIWGDGKQEDYGEYVVDVGEHPLVLRPADAQPSEIRPEYRYCHYLICGKVYAGIFVGRETDG